ncbi:MAG: LysR family transcriptional regulator [Gammaproteobacteria bacterium]|nr:LysR family transcriptional regulator [Gammaproteobacteria bacterium]
MRNLTLRQLQVFEAVARQLSYTRAAQELHLTQPAVSMQVRQLEEIIGLPLFEQMGKKTYLTQAGEELYHYSRVISEQLEEVEEVIAALKGVHRGKLDISVASTANNFGTHLLAAYNKQYPSVTVRLDVTNRETLLQQLANNEKDLVIMGKPPEDVDLVAESFMDNPLVVVASANHPFANNNEMISAETLANEVFVTREPGSGTRSVLERYFTEHQIKLKKGIEMTSNETIKQAVEAGLGLGIVSIHTLSLELEAKRIVVLNIEGFPIMRHWYIVYRKGKRLSPPAEAFRKFVHDNADRLLEKLNT